MAKDLLINANGTGVFTAGSVNFLQITANSAVGITAALLKVRFLSSGTLSNFSIKITSNNDTSNETITTTKNSSTVGNQSISITASTTGTFTDAVNTDTVTSGDDWYATSSSITSAKIIQASITTMLFDTSTTTSKLVNSNQMSSITQPSASTTQYVSLVSGGLLNATEAFTQGKFSSAGTITNSYMYVRTNTRSSASTLGTRINGVNGNISVSVSSATTGAFSDTSHTDTVSLGDLLNYYFTTGAL